MLSAFCRRIALAACFSILLGSAGAAVAQRAAPTGPQPTIDGCGKAQAMLLRNQHEGSPGVVAEALEAMDETDVQHYELDFEISNLNTAQNTCTISGSCRMTIQSKSPALSQFTFRLRSQFNVTSALINDTTPAAVQTLSASTRRVILDQSYGMDQVFTLTIVYSGSTQSTGFGSIEVRDHPSGSVVASLSEPYYAHTWWPVKDGDVNQPGDNTDKATIDVSVTAPNNYVVPSNGLLQSVDALGGNRNRYNWSTVYPVAPYLISFAASTYNTWTLNYNHPGGSMPVEFYIYPHNDTPANRQGWERVVDMLAVFRPIFGEYPFIEEKYGLYNFPFGGGMEHQTMTGQSGYHESLTAHELGHQWWGDAVTCRTWSDIWLNEGFATYAECLWEERKNGSPDLSAYLTAIIGRKPINASGTVYVPASSLSNIARIFDSNLSYRKGAWVLHQLRHVVGDATFFQILSDYRAAFEGSAATTDDFAAVASAMHGEDLGWFFQQWVYEPGTPSYQFGWSTVTVDGQEYLHARVRQVQASPAPNVFTMPVDVHVTVNGMPQVWTVWNNARTQTFVSAVDEVPSSVQFDPQQWILRTVTSASLTVGDTDDDNDVDADDLSAFSSCFTGELGTTDPGCEPVDFEGDGDVDCADFQQFQLAWTAGEPLPSFFQCRPVPAASSWGVLGMLLTLAIAGTVVLGRPRSIGTAQSGAKF